MDKLREDAPKLTLRTLKAAQEAFRCVSEVFRPEKVKLDFSTHSLPQTAIIKMNDQEIAERLVQAEIPTEFITNFSLSNGDTKKTDCAVCLTKADDPYRTSCGHVYCKSCFAAQCSSASSNGSLPPLSRSLSILHPHLHAQGDRIRPYIIRLRKISRILLHNIHPNPTLQPPILPHPDCPSIYRPTITSTLFTCTTCLTPSTQPATSQPMKA